MARDAFRQSPAFQALVLGLFATIAAAILAAVDLGTANAIAERRDEDLRASVSQVVPSGLYDNDMLADTVTISLGAEGEERTVYRARRQGRVAAVAYRVSATGYGGDIVLIMGVDRSGQLLGVRVLEHAETPGLGDKIEVAKSNWILGFEGLSLGNPPPERWKVRKDGGDFDQFTGATITPRAVVAAVKRGLSFFNANRARLLDLQTTKASEAGQGGRG